MKIVADESIPFVKQVFGAHCELVLKPGKEIVRDDLLAARALIIRSLTRVDRDLLYGTPVRFVGSTVSGMDHLDTQWLNEAGIAWQVATACNASAVMEYIICVIAVLQKQGLLMAQERMLRAGVVGVGAIGSKVAHALQLLGFDVVLCDPLRAQNEPTFSSLALSDMADLDLITFHIPLTTAGEYPTYHMIDKTFLLAQKKGCVLINTSRGAVIDSQAFKTYGQHLAWCLDVWEGEPFIDYDLLQLAVIATPHIAGHTVQAKVRGMEIIYKAACQQGILPETIGPAEHIGFDTFYLAPELVLTDAAIADWRDVVLSIFNPLDVTNNLQKMLLEDKDAFEKLRKQYGTRNEFSFIQVSSNVACLPDYALLMQLGLSVK